ncbi:hypothetical protein GCM10029978_044190 [Actinoallomurus acanthiterrae]
MTEEQRETVTDETSSAVAGETFSGVEEETFSSVSLATRDIHLAFGHNRVLRGVDLDVGKGQTACVIGPSGSGKSTFLRTINRLIEPDKGDILLDGESVLESDPDRLRQQVGMVFQQFNLFPHMNVLRNLMLPLRRIRKLSADEAEQAARHHLELVGLADKAGSGPATCPAASSSAWPSPAPSPCGRRSCCSTRPPPPSTPNSSRAS